MKRKKDYKLSLLTAAAVLAFNPCVSFAVTKASPSTVASSPIGDKWAVVIGIADFQDSSVPKLKYSAKDAQDFYDYLTSDTGGHFRSDHVRLLLNQDATKVNIMDTLGDSFLPHAVAPGDLVVIYLSTHGSPAGADLNGVNYVIPYDTNIRKLFATGLEMSQILRVIKERVHTNRIILIMDTCYSGAGAAEHKGLVRTNIDPHKVAAGIGSVVISSSASDQRSYESDELKNSYFTRYFIDSLNSNGGKSPVDQAFKTMKDKVQSAVLRDKGELQTPVMGGGFSGSTPVLSSLPSAPHAAPIVLPDSSSHGASPPATTTEGIESEGSIDLTAYGEHKAKAIELISQHKFWDATHELQQAEKANKKTVECYLLLAEVQDQQGKFQEAMQAAAHAVMNDKESSQAQQQLALEYYRLGQVDYAVRFTEVALSLNPDNAAAHDQLGMINEQRFNKYDEAEQHYRKALELSHLNVDAMVHLGLLLENHKATPDSLKEAEKLFTDALAADADNPDALLALSHLLCANAEKLKFSDGDQKTRFDQIAANYKKAESLLRSAIAVEPANWRLHSELGLVISHDKARYDQAEAELRKGVDLAAERGAPHAMLADFLLHPLNRVDEADREYHRAIELDPNLDGARVALGNLLVDYKKVYDESDSQFRAAIKTNPRNAAAYVGLAHISAQLYKEQGEQAAEQSIRKALTIDDKYAYAYDQLGVLLAQLTGRYVEAQQAFQRSVAIDPYDAVAHYHLGQLLFEQIKDLDGAKKELTKACEQDPSASKYKTALGALYVAQKNYKDAEKCLTDATTTDMRDAEAHYRLGMLYIDHLGRRGSGEAELKKAHELDHDNKMINTSYERYVR